ncbi:hypothetical protein OGAPHI_004076 [Ogataea philodendri]|uniref:Endonuclease n=1 Tax=Ogataea philodendri TaxID=1378263 RepID=A0A9P8P5Z2_9ASCO|nr:uncharacterized protein OGAPHI_004076 [Ogataea philodendri]KAH3665887.1 hypothetical protein OGAPHI_004076 [Ogataea philodendri]
MFRPIHTVPLLSIGSLSYFFWGRGDKSSSSPAPAPGGFPISDNVPSGSSRVPAPSKPGQVPANPPQVNPGGFFSYGFPGPVHDLETRAEFVSVYDRQKRNPYYVVEHITPESLKRDPNGGGDRKNSVFKEDEQIPIKFRALLKDYFRSGYDRGHQAPAADAKFSQAAMDETFYLTNMSPQVGAGFNRDYWAHFEDFVRRLTGGYQSIRVVTGPLYLPKKDPVDGKYKVTYEVIGNPPNIAVPTHFFKLVVAEKSFKRGPNSDDIAVAAFVLPNAIIPNEVPLTSFEVPVDALERSSGLEFLKMVPENKKKQLCKEFSCNIIVREFNNSTKSLPSA